MSVCSSVVLVLYGRLAGPTLGPAVAAPAGRTSTSSPTVGSEGQSDQITPTT